MAEAAIEALLKRHARAWSRRDKWTNLLQDAYELALPQREIFTDHSEGQRKTDRVFDSTAQESVTAFANRMLSELTPPFQRWYELQAGPAVPEEQRENIDKELEKVTAISSAVFQTGQFSTAAHEMYLELAAGTGAMMVLEGDDQEPVRFVSVPIAQIALEDGPWGTIGAIHRKHKMEARLVDQTWPDATIPTDLEELAKDEGKDRDTEVELAEITYWQPKERNWRYVVIWKDQKEQLVERFYNTNPWITPRWMKVPGETMGRGPLLAALPDIKTANKIVEMILKNAALSLAGVYLASDLGVTNPDTVRITPGAIIQVDRTGGPNGPSIVPLETGRGFDIGELVLDRLQMHIKKLLLDNQLPPDAGPVRSATEIVQRVKELTQDAGAALGRLLNELIVPLVRRVLDILKRKGVIDLDIEVNQFGVKVAVISPLARVQNLEDVQNVVQWLSIGNSLAGPQVVALAAKVEEILPWIADQLGVPSDLVRSSEERDRMQKEVASVIAANQNMQGAAVDAARGGGGVEDLAA